MITKKSMKILAYVGAGAFATFFASCSSKPTLQEQISRDPAAFWETGLSDSEVLKASSSPALKLSSGKIIIDNDAAFEAKLDAIRSAKSGETVRMVYYIYSDDHSSSLFTSEVLAAAQRGVKFKILLDFISNYKYLDLFTMMEKEAKGNVQVRLFGRPSNLIVRDAYFLSMPCPATNGVPDVKHCSDHKWNTITGQLSKESNPGLSSDFYSGLLLSGIYAKNGAAIKTGLMVGQQIDLKALNSSAPKSAAEAKQQKEQLKQLLKLVYQAKIKGDDMAYLKLYMAMLMYRDDVNPVLNQVYGRLPLEQMEKSESTDHWEHLTDFIHHKLLLVGERHFQLGGRNIEDSYHMKQNSLSKKYTFSDTDFAADVEKGGASIAESFDRLWNFNEMAISIADTRRLMDNDLIANPQAFGAAAVKCSKNPERSAFKTCVQETAKADASYKNLDARASEQVTLMNKNKAVYASQYAPTKKITQSWKSGTVYEDTMSSQDLNQALVTYVENVPFNPKDKTPTRLLGAFNRQELKYGKAIHHLWVRGLRNTCDAAKRSGTEKRVVFNTAYWIPPTNIMRTFAKMIDGSWDCRNVKVTILTNSFETTDLNIINIFAKWQMKAFFDTYHNRKKEFGSASNKAAKFEYFEYVKPAGAKDSQVLSLHTKLTVLGDDMILGSANSDVRSYYMDTNNGIFIRNASDMIAQYLKYIDTQTSNRTLTRDMTKQFSQSVATLKTQDAMFMDALRARFKFLQKIPADLYGDLKAAQQAIAQNIYDESMALLSNSYYEDSDQPIQIRVRDRVIETDRRKIEKSFNRALQVL